MKSCTLRRILSLLELFRSALWFSFLSYSLTSSSIVQFVVHCKYSFGYYQWQTKSFFQLLPEICVSAGVFCVFCIGVDRLLSALLIPFRIKRKRLYLTVTLLRNSYPRNIHSSTSSRFPSTAHTRCISWSSSMSLSQFTNQIWNYRQQTDE